LGNARGSPYRDAASTTQLSTPQRGDAPPIGGATNAALRVLQQQPSVMATSPIGGTRSGNARGSPFRDAALNAQSPPTLERGSIQLEGQPICWNHTADKTKSPQHPSQ
jgi:hypothetical protein